jgi:hypothetical protein
MRARETLSYWGEPAEEEPPPEERLAELEERFAELFKAARALLVLLREEGEVEEDLIYPTLAYANELGLGIVVYYPSERGREILDLDKEAGMLVSAKPGTDWDAAVKRFVRRHAGMVPERVSRDGAVILRWLAVDGGVRYYPIPERKIPEEVTLRISLYTGKLEPRLDVIRAVYERTLSAHGLRYGKSSTAGLHHAFDGDELFVWTYASTDTDSRISARDAAVVFRGRDPEFMHPELMVGLCQVLLRFRRSEHDPRHGFDHFLNRRKSGRPPTKTPKSTAKFIRACVAYFLAVHGGLPEGIAAHRVLNKHLRPLPEVVGELPEVGVSTDESRDLWRAAEKAGVMLGAAGRAIYDHEF